MEKYIYNEQNGLWYELQGDYYIPCLVLDEEDSQPIGMWGRKHLRYIKEHRRALYTTLLISGKLNGRGAYVCPDAACLQKARKTRSLERCLEVEIPEEVYNRLTREMEGNTLG